MKANRFFGTLKRSICVLISAVLVLFSPVHAYVASASVTIAAGAYAIIAILAACGILATSDTFKALIGSFSSEAEYLALGARRQLGTYAQRIYDKAHGGEDLAIQEKFMLLEAALISAVCCNWGDTVSGIQALADDLKEFLKGCIGFTNSGAFIQVPVVPGDETWGVTEWGSLDKCPLPSGYTTSPFFVSQPGYTFLLSNYLLSAWSPETMNVQNWYCDEGIDLFAFYAAEKNLLTFYKRNAASSSYALYDAYIYSAYMNSDGTLKYSTSSTSYFQGHVALCSPADAGELPFPVFYTVADMEHYAATGEALNTYVSGTLTTPLEGYRADVMGLASGAIADVLQMPLTADAGMEHIGLIRSVYPAGTVEDVQEAVKAGGLAMDNVTDVPATGTISDVLSALAALPDSIAKAVADAFSLAEDAGEQLSVPEIISRKFPFCVPFDFAYLIGILAAEPVTPRFVLPFRFDYDQWHFSYDFVIDLSSWEPLAAMVRIMLDILFCASLMLGTRSLIRG